MKTKKVTLDLETILPLCINTWRKFRKEGGPSDHLQTREFRGVVEAIQLLHSGLHEDKSLVGKDYFEKPELLGAYLLYNWVISYQQGMSLIAELPNPPKRVLDLCSGSISFGLAAMRHGASELYALDRNEQALMLGAEICGKLGYPVNIRKADCLRPTLPVEGHFDLIIIGHALDELFPTTQKDWKNKQQFFLKSLLNRLTPDGYLLLVENSFSEANKRILEIREQLIQLGAPVQAPCVWKGECPALQTPNSPCYAQREYEKPNLLKQIQRAAEINLSSLKMTYIIFKSPQAAWPQLPETPLFRIISPPVESHHGKSYYLCGTEGKKKINSRMKVHPKESRAFDFLKRGELISINHAVDTRNGLEIVEGTTMLLQYC